MMLSPIVDGLADDLLRAAAVGSDEVQQAAGLLTAALGASVRMRLLEMLEQAAAELSASLPGGVAEVRLREGEPVMVFEPVAEAGLPGTGPAPEGETPDEAEPDGESARITLRLPEGLKRQIESAAAGGGVSVNTWLVDVAARALRQPAQGLGGTWRGGPKRFSGFVRG